MNFSAAFSLVSALALIVASPMTPRYVSDIVTDTLDYSGIQPPVYPPDGGCIIVARLYKNDNQLRVYDSSPVCVPDATVFDHIKNDYKFKNHRLTGHDKDDMIWAAYGKVYPEAMNRWTTKIGCVFPDADVSKPCQDNHEYLPDGMAFPDPWTRSLIAPDWTTDREVTGTPSF